MILFRRRLFWREGGNPRRFQDLLVSQIGRFGLGALCAALLYLPMQNLEAKEAKAIFAGGCFWCMEQAFDDVNGVTETIAGYIGGKIPDPTYNQVGRWSERSQRGSAGAL